MTRPLCAVSISTMPYQSTQAEPTLSGLADPQRILFFLVHVSSSWLTKVTKPKNGNLTPSVPNRNHNGLQGLRHRFRCVTFSFLATQARGPAKRPGRRHITDVMVLEKRSSSTYAHTVSK